MPNLLSGTAVSFRTGLLNDHFDTFARNLVIYKSPKRDLTSLPAYAGYGPDSVEGTVNYTPVSGVYPCLKVEQIDPQLMPLTDAQTQTYTSILRIKVKPNAAAFINNGKNELFLFDGLAYNQASESVPVNYLGLQFYYYTLTRTN